MRGRLPEEEEDGGGDEGGEREVEAVGAVRQDHRVVDGYIVRKSNTMFNQG